MSEAQWPQTEEQWQDAVDAAEALVLLDSARHYGLVTGGPTVNLPRCEAIISEGQRRGILPRRDALDRLVRELGAEDR